MPHVKTFFYHSQAESADGEPVNFLEGYAGLAPQWVWGGNVLN